MASYLQRPPGMRFIVLAALASLGACGGTLGGGNGDGGTGNDGGGGAACSSASDCKPSEYCDRGGSCGTSGTKGACKARPMGCTDVYSPTCGCDGVVYGNACDAAGHGVDVGPASKCAPPQGWVACGDRYCEATASYCQRTPNDVVGPGEPLESDQCLPLPPACQGKSDCSCFPLMTPCIDPKLQGVGCKAVPAGTVTGFVVTCPGG